MKSLLIIGAGEYGQLVHEIAEALAYDKIEYLDDNSILAIGTVKEFPHFEGQYEEFIVAIGNPEIRKSLFENLSRCFSPATLIHPRAYVSPSASIGRGTIIEPMAVVQSNSVVGEGCIINTGAVVNHNCKVGAYSQIDCNATVSARTEVKSGVKILAGSVFS